MWVVVLVVIVMAGWVWFALGIKRTPEEQAKASELDAELEKFACVLTSSVARVHIQFGVRGCFGGTDNLLELRVGPEETIARGWGTAGWDRFREAKPVPLPIAEGRRYLTELVAAARRREISNNCWSSAFTIVRIHYWCGADKRGPVMLKTSMCDPEEHAGLMPKWLLPAYARAWGVKNVAENILTKLPGKELSASEEVERARRKWGTRYQNGQRVRHNPVEDWSDP